jgi:hypothetical protein
MSEVNIPIEETKDLKPTENIKIEDVKVNMEEEVPEKIDSNETVKTDDSQLINFYTTLLCANFFRFELMLRLIHWQTDSYAVHKASDQLLTDMHESVDDLLETIQGMLLSKYDGLKGKVIIDSSCKIQLENQTETNAQPTNFIELLKKFENFLQNQLETEILRKLLPIEDISSILNVRDDILNSVQKTRYLASLK